MGICCSGARGGLSAVGGTVSQSNAAHCPNEAIDSFPTSRGYNRMLSWIQLSLLASNLHDRALFSKSDPMAVVYVRKRNGELDELGRTEVVLNSLDPVWIMKQNIMYNFEVVQNLVFHVYDVDTQFHNVDVKMIRLEEQQFVGEATCTLAEIVTKSIQSLNLNLVPRGKSTTSSPSFGQLTVRAEEWVKSRTTTELILRCSQSTPKDLDSRRASFIVISKEVESNVSIPLCKTEVIKNSHELTWQPIVLSSQQVGSKDNPLDLEWYNFNGSGKHDMRGKVHSSLTELENLFSCKQGENLFRPIDDSNNTDRQQLNSQLFVDKFSESIQHTFLDYLAGGYKLNFMVAIDFTASNGNPRLPDSLHYIDPSGRPNAYQQAVLEVGEILQCYDSDKRFPAWGFGARPIDGPVSHCFNLNGSNNYYEVEGINGILKAYASALSNVSLAGPTLFARIISSAAHIASQTLANGQQKYFVLLIITDGVVTDLQETTDAIVYASDLPLSILIVGVGGADFKDMEVLDNGETLMSSAGHFATRNIVQFVRQRDVQTGGKVTFLQSLLAEIPAQFLSYMRARGIHMDS